MQKPEEMKPFITTRSVLATSMTRADYNEYQGWELPEDEDGTDEGYLIEYVDSPNSNHDNHEGYISWSPKDVFDRCSKEVVKTNEAIELAARMR